MTAARSVVLAVVLCGAGANASQAATYYIEPGEPNAVVFESRAPLESFAGRTRHIQGHVSLDETSPGDSVEVHIEVDLGTLDTGIPLRNRHMCDNHLETTTYPKALFRGARVVESAGRLAEPAGLALQVEGTMELHGVRRRLSAPVQLQLVDGKSGRELHITTHFEIRLSEYAIKRPKFLVMKLDEVQRVQVNLVALAK